MAQDHDGSADSVEPDPADVDPTATAGNGEELTDEEARERLGVSGGGIDRKKMIIGGIVAIIFLIIIFANIIPRFANYSEVPQYLQSMTTAAIVGLVLVVLWYLFFYGWPFVAATPGLRYKHGFIVNQSAFTVSNGVPAVGGALGLGLQYAQLTSYKTTPTAATAAIGATGVWSVFVTMFLPVTGFVALSAAGDDASSYVNAALLGIGLLAAAIILFALILRSEANARRIGGWTDALVGWVFKRFGKESSLDVTAQVLKLRQDIVGLVTKRWLVITLVQIGVSWSQFAILYAAMVGVSGDAGAPPLLLVYGCWAIASLGILIPVTPGGVGTVDAAMIGLMTSFGIDSGLATAADLVWRASSFFVQIGVGLICIFYWRWEINRQRKKAAAAAA